MKLRKILGITLGCVVLSLTGCDKPDPLDLQFVRRISFMRNYEVCVFNGSDGKQYDVGGTNGVAELVQYYNPPEQVQIEDLSVQEQSFYQQNFVECSEFGK